MPDAPDIIALSPEATANLYFAARHFAELLVVAALWGSKALDAAQQLFFADRIEVDRIIVAGALDERGSAGFGLVDLDIFLQRMDEILVQVLGRNGAVADFAQGNNGILVVVARDGNLGARGNHARTVSGHENQVKAVLDLFNAVFNGDACHERLHS